MLECIARIMLRPVIFFNNGICRQIQKQAYILSRKIPPKNLRQSIVIRNLPDHNPGTDLQPAASFCPIRHLHVRKEFHVVFVRLHHSRICLRTFPDRLPISYGELSFLVVNPSVFILDISGVSLGSVGDFPRYIRDFDYRIQVQSMAPPLVGIPSKSIVPQMLMQVNEKMLETR